MTTEPRLPPGLRPPEPKPWWAKLLSDPPPNLGSHLFIGLCSILLFAVVVWSTVGRLDIVASAIGEVVPSTQLKSVQHLEGGIVREILIKEGDKVTAGQPLVELDPLKTGQDVEEIKIRVDSYRISIARLEAELDGQADWRVPADLAAALPDVATQAEALFQSRLQRKESQIKALERQVVQRRQEIKEAQARLDTNRKNLELVKGQLEVSERLLKLDLTNRLEHLNIVRDSESLLGKIREDNALMPRLQAAQAEVEANLDAARSAFAEETRRELEDIQVKRRELEQRLLKFEDTLDRTVLRSPVDGVVKTLHVHTQGGVVEGGKTVIDIVPAGDKLIIEAKLPTRDIGYVRPGQDVAIQLASAEAVRFGTLNGRVIQVSPDTYVTRDGQAHYKVRVETDQAYFQRGDLRYDLVAGMQVTCNILTGSRSVLAYIFEPYLGSMAHAMKER